MTLFWIFFGLFLAFDISLASLVFVRGIQSSSWPTVEGTVDSSHFDVVVSDESNAYSIKVRYSYTVNDVSYVSRRFYFGLHYFKFKPPAWLLAQTTRDDFRRDRHCRVYYHPKKPRLSTLVPGIKISYGISMVFYAWLALFIPIQRPLLEHLI